MEARGLIERVTGPGRALRHRLTSAGEELLLQGHSVVNKVLSESFSPLSPTELETLYGLLTRLVQEADEPPG